MTDRTREILEEWFIRHNPFYLASACLTLLGARQLAIALDEIRWQGDGIMPLAILAIYQLLLVLCALFLVRRKGMQRAAVVLALVENLFLADPTLQNALIATHLGRAVGLVAAAGSILVQFFVARALRRAVGARFPLALPFAAIAGITFVPYFLDSRGQLFPLLVAGAALTVASSWWPVVIEVDGADEWTQTVARRAGRFLTVFFPLAFVVHLLVWWDIFALTFTFDQATLLLFIAAYVLATRSYRIGAVTASLWLILKWDDLGVGPVGRAVILLAAGFALLLGGTALHVWVSDRKPSRP